MTWALIVGYNKVTLPYQHQVLACIYITMRLVLWMVLGSTIDHFFYEVIPGLFKDSIVSDKFDNFTK